MLIMYMSVLCYSIALLLYLYLANSNTITDNFMQFQYIKQFKFSRVIVTLLSEIWASNRVLLKH